MNSHSIALLPGDGIGPEVAEAAVRVLDAAASQDGFALEWRHYDWGSDYYRRRGRMMPEDAIDQLAGADAVFLGAVGDPQIPDAETLWGMLVPIRRQFDQYVNLRPVRSLDGVASRLPSDVTVDVVLVRENSEGEYSTVGGRSGIGLPTESAYQQAVFTRYGVERITRYACEISRARSGRLLSATKSNGIIHSMTYWDEVVRSVIVHEYPWLDLRSVLIDALVAEVVSRPERLDVIVASNLFGDILADALAAVVGSIGIAPSANLDPSRRHPSMFEPVHGSAPDIAGKGIANPIGQIWSGAMMLDHLGRNDTAARVVAAIERVLADGVSTPDLGGQATTAQVTDAVVDRLSGRGPR